MKSLGVALLSWLALGASVRAHGSDPLTTDSSATRAIDEYIVAKMRSARIPGLAVAVVRGDRVVLLKGYGRADESGRPVTPQTPFMIGSITKSFTALAVMQLVEAGRIDLDAPAQRYIPWFRVADPVASAQITVRELLTMTSGLPQIYETQLWSEGDDRALERTVRILRSARVSEPGKSFGYSNANYETLGVILQAVSGRSYEDYVKERIFAPLDMRNTFVSQDEALRHGMASGYRWWFGIPFPVTLPYRRAELPAGYIISSAEDMTHYLIAQMNDGQYRDRSVISPDGMAFMHREPARGRYGIGWESLRVDGRRLINHDGGTANFQSSLFFDPGAKVGVIILANAINALDAFASPHGSSILDGQTTRAMAQRVLSIETSRPPPSDAPGHERLTLLFDLAIAVLTAALVRSVARIPVRFRRLAERGPSNWVRLTLHIGRVALLNLALPAVMSYLVLAVPAWPAFALFEPDLACWLYAVAGVLVIKALLELALLGILFRRHPSSRPPSPPISVQSARRRTMDDIYI